jgi:hypothetical protein
MLPNVNCCIDSHLHRFLEEIVMFHELAIYSLFGIFLILQFLDVALAYHVLGVGKTSLNPIMRWLASKVGSIVALVVPKLPAIGGLGYLIYRYDATLVMVFWVAFSDLVYLLVILHNLIHIRSTHE